MGTFLSGPVLESGHVYQLQMNGSPRHDKRGIHNERSDVSGADGSEPRIMNVLTITS